jgi:hypothetical protein
LNWAKNSEVMVMQLICSWLLAGLKQYDPDGVDAEAIEAAIEGVHVIRHGKCNIHSHNWLF